MTGIGKVMIVAGIVLALMGICVWGLGRIGFRGLPGDVKIEAQGMRVYFPIVTCVVLSIVATAAMWIWQWWGRK